MYLKVFQEKMRGVARLLLRRLEKNRHMYLTSERRFISVRQIYRLQCTFRENVLSTQLHKKALMITQNKTQHDAHRRELRLPFLSQSSLPGRELPLRGSTDHPTRRLLRRRRLRRERSPLPFQIHRKAHNLSD